MTRFVIMMVACAFIASACRTASEQPLGIPTTTLEQSTNTRIVHSERIDTEMYHLPPQLVEITTTDSISHIETDIAESNAILMPDGTIRHTLKNKTGQVPIPIITSADTIYVYTAVEKPVKVEVPVPVERKLSWWERIRLNTWAWMAIAVVVCAVWIFRRPLTTLARSLLQ